LVETKEKVSLDARREAVLADNEVNSAATTCTIADTASSCGDVPAGTQIDMSADKAAVQSTASATACSGKDRNTASKALVEDAACAPRKVRGKRGKSAATAETPPSCGPHE
jgi:hypothetical protein